MFLVLKSTEVQFQCKLFFLFFSSPKMSATIYWCVLSVEVGFSRFHY